jgi:periplasmic protein CpxP/Spy
MQKIRRPIMNRKFLIAATLGLGLALSGGAAALAQGGYQCPMGGEGPGAGMGKGMGMGMGMHGKMHGGGMGPEKMCADHDARQAGMLAYAEKKLAITDAQRDAWNAVVTAMKSNNEAMTKMCDAAKTVDPAAPVTLPQRLDRMQAMTTMRVEHMGKVIPAVKALYEKLTPEQKTVADGLFAHGPMGGMGGMHR